jgi:anti-sigma regulatory factor (Ser/Thr protein kinase)
LELVTVQNTLERTYRAAADAVPAARCAVAEFAQGLGATDAQLDAIRLAVSETVTNAVVHAYPCAPNGEINLTAALAGGELWVLVADDGVGHQTPPRRPGLGWGLPLVAEAADSFVVAERSGGGTEVQMRFRLGC